MSEVLASIEVVFDEAPPVSVNKLYTVFMGKKQLTAEGRHYRAMLSAAVTEALPFNWGEVVDAAHTLPAYVDLTLVFGVPGFYNKSWRPGQLVVPKKPTKGVEPSRSSPYQKKDSSNYVKLTQDAIALATTIDDSFEHRQTIVKRPADKWYVIIEYSVIRDESYGH